MPISDKAARSLELQANDLLFVEGSGSIKEVGRCAVWDGLIADIVHQNSVIRARLSIDDIDSRFVSTWFNSPAGSTFIRQRATTTSGLYHIGAGKLAEAPIPIPPRTVQRRLISQLEADLSASADHGARASALRHDALAVVKRELVS
jgi:type I restriction enzyme S subunit